MRTRYGTMIFVLLVGLGQITFATGQPDTTPPQVVSTFPADNQRDVPVTTKTIIVNFSEPVAMEGATLELVLGAGDERRRYRIRRTMTDGDKTLRMEILSPFPLEDTTKLGTIGQTWYEVALYFVDNAMPGNEGFHRFRFFTAGAPTDTTPPRIVSSVPPNGAQNVRVNVDITVTFSEPVRVREETGIVLLRVTETGTMPAPIVARFNPDSTVLTIDPVGDLEFITEYIVHLPMEDLAGNPLAPPADIRFFTERMPDTTPPRVVSIVPANGAVNVPLTTTIVVTFSEPVRVTAPPHLVQVQPEGIAPPIQFQLDEAGQVLTITPKASLTAGARYAVNLGSIVDLAGLPLTGPTVFFFTTVTEAPPPGALQVTVSPTSVRLASGQSVAVLYSFRELSGGLVTITESVGTFKTPGGQELGQFPLPVQPFIRLLPKGSASLTANLLLPDAIFKAATKANAAQLVFTRTFLGRRGDGQEISASADTVITLSSPLATSFSITAIHVDLPLNGSIVVLNGTLKAHAYILGTGTGTFVGAWVVDERIVETFTKTMVNGEPISISPSRPLPTLELGWHQLRVRILQPSPFDSQPILYFVTNEAAASLSLLSPQNDVTFTRTQPPPTFSWTAAPAAARYEIGFFRSGEGVAQAQWFATEQTSFTPSDTYWKNLADGEYRWVVRAISAQNEPGAPSAAFTFRLLGTIGTIKLLMPTAEATVDTLSPQFQWTCTLTASHFLLTFASNADMTQPLTQIMVSGTEANQTVNYTYSSDVPLTDETKYQWQVKAFDSQGQLLAESPVGAFLVQAPSVDVAVEFVGVTDENNNDVPILNGKVFVLPGQWVTLKYAVKNLSPSPQDNRTVRLMQGDDTLVAEHFLSKLPGDKVEQLSVKWRVPDDIRFAPVPLRLVVDSAPQEAEEKLANNIAALEAHRKVDVQMEFPIVLLIDGWRVVIESGTLSVLEGRPVGNDLHGYVELPGTLTVKDEQGNPKANQLGFTDGNFVQQENGDFEFYAQVGTDKAKRLETKTGLVLELTQPAEVDLSSEQPENEPKRTERALRLPKGTLTLPAKYVGNEKDVTIEFSNLLINKDGVSGTIETDSPLTFRPSQFVLQIDHAKFTVSKNDVTYGEMKGSVTLPPAWKASNPIQAERIIYEKPEGTERAGFLIENLTGIPPITPGGEVGKVIERIQIERLSIDLSPRLDVQKPQAGNQPSTPSPSGIPSPQTEGFRPRFIQVSADPLPLLARWQGGIGTPTMPSQPSGETSPTGQQGDGSFEGIVIYQGEFLFKVDWLDHPDGGLRFTVTDLVVKMGDDLLFKGHVQLATSDMKPHTLVNLKDFRIIFTKLEGNLDTSKSPYLHDIDLEAKLVLPKPLRKSKPSEGTEEQPNEQPPSEDGDGIDTDASIVDIKTNTDSLRDLVLCVENLQAEFSVGQTGFTVKAEGICVDFSVTKNPDGVNLAAAYGKDMGVEWKGVFLKKIALGLPERFKGTGNVSASVGVENFAVGNGGLAGTVNIKGMNLKAVFSGFDATLQEVGVQFVNSQIKDASIKVLLNQVPFLKQDVTVSVAVSNEGDVQGTVEVSPEKPLSRIFADRVILTLTSGTIGYENEVGFLMLDGGIAFRIKGKDYGAKLDDLRIESDGDVSFKGVWVTLNGEEKWDFNGFSFNVNRIGAGIDGSIAQSEKTRYLANAYLLMAPSQSQGQTSSGTQGNLVWFGFGGNLQLSDDLPVSGGVGTDEVKFWFTKDGEFVRIEVSDIRFRFTWQKVLNLDGKVRWQEEGAVKEFRGDINGVLTLSGDSGIAIRMGAVIGQTDAEGGFNYWMVRGQVQLPTGILLGQTNLGLFGFNGGMARRMRWERFFDDPVPDKSVAYTFKAGVTIGTYADNGYAFNADATLSVAQGPIISFEGNGWVITARTERSSTPHLVLFMTYNHQKREFLATLNANFEKSVKGIPIVQLTGQCELYIGPGKDNWHFYAGRKERPIQVVLLPPLEIYKLQGYLMAEPQQILIGGFVGFDWDTEFSYKGYGIYASAYFSGGFDAEFKPIRPLRFAAEVYISGGVNAGVKAAGKKYGVSLTASVNLETRGPDPLYAYGKFKADLPVVGKTEFEVAYGDYKRRSEQPVPTLEEIGGIENVSPFQQQTDVPMDAPIIVTFTLPTNFESFPTKPKAAAAPQTPQAKVKERVTRIGDYTVKLRLHRVQLVPVPSASVVKEVTGALKVTGAPTGTGQKTVAGVAGQFVGQLTSVPSGQQVQQITQWLGSDQAIPLWFDGDEDERRFRFRPQQLLAPSTTHRIEVDLQITVLRGTEIVLDDRQTHQFTFTTKKLDSLDELLADARPEEGAVVFPNTDAKLTFHTDIAPAVGTNLTLELRDAAGTAVPATLRRSPTGLTFLELLPEQPLHLSSVYILTVPPLVSGQSPLFTSRFATSRFENFTALAQQAQLSFTNPNPSDFPPPSPSLPQPPTTDKGLPSKTGAGAKPPSSTGKGLPTKPGGGAASLGFSVNNAGNTGGMLSSALNSAALNSILKNVLKGSNAVVPLTPPAPTVTVLLEESINWDDVDAQFELASGIQPLDCVVLTGLTPEQQQQVQAKPEDIKFSLRREGTSIGRAATYRLIGKFGDLDLPLSLKRGSYTLRLTYLSLWQGQLQTETVKLTWTVP